MDLCRAVEEYLLCVPDNATCCELLKEKVAHWGKGSKVLVREFSRTLIGSWLPVSVLHVQTGMLVRGQRREA